MSNRDTQRTTAVLAARGVDVGPETYRIVDVNRDLSRVYHGVELIGHVRRGLDGLWNPELPDERTRSAAMHAVIIAHQAIAEFTAALDGDG